MEEKYLLDEYPGAETATSKSKLRRPCGSFTCALLVDQASCSDMDTVTVYKDGTYHLSDVATKDGDILAVFQISYTKTK